MAPPELIAKYRGKYKAGWDRLRDERYRRQIKMGLIDGTLATQPARSGITRLGFAVAPRRRTDSII